MRGCRAARLDLGVSLGPIVGMKKNWKRRGGEECNLLNGVIYEVGWVFCWRMGGP